MGLGSDKTIAMNEFVAAMRARLESEQAGLGANVDDKSVSENLGALGQAVYRIATVHAETRSDTTADSAFWQWIIDVDDWLHDLAAWRQGVTKAFADWTAAGTANQKLKADIAALSAPGSLPSPPTFMKGKIK
jgi:hypothetical protein